MKDSDISAVKAASLTTLARGYGLEVNRAGFCRCPFHSGGNERTGSLKIYEDESRWHCFACGCGGSIIDFAMRMDGCDFRGAVQRINALCGLGLALDHKETPQERQRREQEAQRRAAIKAIQTGFEAWEEQFYSRLAGCLRVANHALVFGPPWTKQEAEAVKRQAELEFYADILCGESAAGKLQVFRNRAEIEKIINPILEVEHERIDSCTAFRHCRKIGRSDASRPRHCRTDERSGHRLPARHSP